MITEHKTQLDAYLYAPEALSLREVARRAGVSAPFLYDLRKGKRNATAEVAQRIADATGGAVDAASMVRK